MIDSRPWSYAKTVRHQLQNAADRCAREAKDGNITEEQAGAILEPLREAIRAAVIAEGAVPPRRHLPGIEIHGRLPTDEPHPPPATPEPMTPHVYPFGIPYPVE